MKYDIEKKTYNLDIGHMYRDTDIEGKKDPYLMLVDIGVDNFDDRIIYMFYWLDEPFHIISCYREEALEYWEHI